MWLLKETWHSAISPYRIFDLIRYRYTNGRPSRVEVWNGASDFSSVSSYTLYYLQFNWHGDTAIWVATNGDGNYDAWTTNDPFGIYTASTPKDYYYWNGGWGYLYFSKLNLYYAHGRWYNPVIALWLSPEESAQICWAGWYRPLESGRQFPDTAGQTR